MPCEICNHTIQNLGVTGRRVFWCPRCGSLKEESGDFVETSSPMIVKRLRELPVKSILDAMHDTESNVAIPLGYWNTINESIGKEHHEISQQDS